MTEPRQPKTNKRKIRNLCIKHNIHQILPEPNKQWTVSMVNLKPSRILTLKHNQIINQQGEIRRYKANKTNIYTVTNQAYNTILEILETTNSLNKQTLHSQVPESISTNITQDIVQQAETELEQITNTDKKANYGGNKQQNTSLSKKLEQMNPEDLGL